jgi:hypothetical protein
MCMNSLTLTVWNKFLVEKRIFYQPIMKFSAFYESRRLGSQKPNTESCFELNTSNPSRVICLFLNTCFSNMSIFPCILKASKSPSPI